MARLTNETIRKELLESGFNWEAGEYKNLDSSLTLECYRDWETGLIIVTGKQV